MSTHITDSSWVKQSFLLASTDLEKIDQANRFFTSASLKYTDTTPGGNHAVNPPPQFTRYADPKATTRFQSGKGLGIYYSEAIDDHSQLIHMRFGVPQFNSMTQFFTHFYNTGAGVLARTGRDSTGLLYNIGRAVGFVVSVMSWKILAIHLAGMAFKFFTQKPSTKFYYLKPTMPVYWQAVQTIVNQIAVNKGIIPRALSSPSTHPDPIGGDLEVGAVNTNSIGGNYQFDAGGLNALHTLLPDIFFAGGGIDVYALANRAKRLERQQMKSYTQSLDNASVNLNTGLLQVFGPTAMLQDTKKTDFLSYLKNWFAVPASQSANANDLIAGDSNNDAGTEGIDLNSGNLQSLGTFFESELDEGSAFVTFRVNATGPVTDSFQSQAADSELANKINSMSSQSRSTRFDIESGDISDNTIGKLAGHALQGVQDIVSGLADGFGLSGLAALGGSAFVDIPKHWQSSSGQLSRSTYTMNLISPYGNPISQLLNLYIPVAMLLAGTLPLATGAQSYTSPFICELYDRGRCQIRLGIIDSLSITRGTSNLAFDADGNAMAIDVSFTVLDLSNLVYLPITQGLTSAASSFLGALGMGVGGVSGAIDAVVSTAEGTATAASAGAQVVAGAQAGGAALAAVGAPLDGAANLVTSLNGLFDGDTPFADYMAVLGGLGLADQIYSMRRFKLNLTMQMTEWRSWLSPSHYASVLGDVLPAKLIKAFFQGVDNN
jgi:hypothetical protein